ncbi:MAG: MauE/DoxX family redox-associated membrane protein [Ilumatobacteraceae bacterium]|jgi:hypothetical protein
MVSRLLAAVVGATLAVAGATKLLDYRGWMRDARAQSVWPAVALLVPPTEIVIGASLVALDPSPLSLGASTVLLLVFTAFLLASVVAGSTVPCACFGSVRRRPPSWRDVLRNIALMGLLVVSAAGM